MTLRVPYIADEAIERDAEALLAQYAHAKGIKIKPPIPIEDIVEKHLKLRVEFDDLHRLLDIPRSGIGLHPDIFGAIWLESGKIVIDESLDPEERPELEGRYRYTLAHEGGGHWRLHRPLVRPTRDHQRSLLIEAARPTVVCRSSQAKERVEWQANFYASCLLMPRKLVFAAWDEAFPDRKQRVLQPATLIDHPFVAIARIECRIPGAEFTESDDQALDVFAKPFAKKFLVSPIAMRRARKAQFAACHFLMLDDLGSKVPLERLGGLELSWLIETSPGNHQGGIILAEPLTDGAVAVRLLNAVIDSGLCDAGATGPLSRWARLPVAINGKPKYAGDTPFQCRLIEWRPNNRYTPQEIVDRLQLELAPAGRPKKTPKPSARSDRTSNSIGNDADDVLTPKAAKNPVVAVLKPVYVVRAPDPNARGRWVTLGYPHNAATPIARH